MKHNIETIIIAVLLVILIILITFHATLLWADEQIKRIRSNDETTAEVETVIKKETVEPKAMNIITCDVKETEAHTEEAQPQEMPEPVYLGEYKLTAYCPCEICSECYENGTSTGTTATAGRTIAVDPSVIPYGSTVIINGNEYIAEDCGGAVYGNHIDIFFDTHEEALNFGVKYADVFLKGN